MSDEQWFRLGYWDKRETRDENEIPEIVYGIRVAFDERRQSPNWVLRKQAKRYSNENARGRNKAMLTEPTLMNECAVRTCRCCNWPICQHSRKICAWSKCPRCQHSARGCTCVEWPKCEHYPYRHNSGVSRWYLITCVLVVWAALIASIYALIRHWPQHGFDVSNDWSLPADLNLNTTVIGHTINLDLTSPSDPKETLLVYAILFRSIPTYTAGLFINTIIPTIDLNVRFIQPFVEMLPTVQQPGQAAKTVLLDYITLSSLQIPLTAYANEHNKVSWFSTLNTISPLFPIFLGGLLTVAPTKDGEAVHLSFSLSAYIGIIVSLVLYGISLPFGYPHAHLLLPRQIYSMADLMAMCYTSRFMASPYLDITHSRKCPSKAHMEACILNNRDEFKFGMYWAATRDCTLASTSLPQRNQLVQE